jgi:hypothetical protein
MFWAIFLTVGNGTVTAPNGGQDYGNSLLKLSPSGEVLDWFIPYNFKTLNDYDWDFGSTGVLLVSGANLAVTASKEGKLYLFDRDNLGHFQPGSEDQRVQSFSAAAGPLYGTPTLWNGPDGTYVYTWGSGPDSDRGKMFRIRGGLLEEAPVSQTAVLAKGLPGGIVSISSDGARPGTGIFWAVLGLGDASDDASKSPPGIAYAFDAADLSHELWNSRQNASRDDLGLLSKFIMPVVANGKVYIAASTQVSVYGLLPEVNKAE